MSVPRRWQNCPKISDLIAGRFLPFKTFLDSRYDAKVPKEKRWQLPMFLKCLNTGVLYTETLGLVIDLTYTNRYYNWEDFDDTGIKYIKIKCRGHGEAPTEEQTNRFIRACSEFWNREPDKIIGIYCTHGFNRTGFLIISYLVEVLEWSLEAAHQAFSESRPPGIYKQDYLNVLCTRYNWSERLHAPEPPEWYLE